MMDKGIKIIDDTGKVVSEQLVRREFDNKITDKIDKRSIIFILCKNDAATILLYLRCISKRIWRVEV